MSITFIGTSVEDILPLRHRILRAGLPIETAMFDGDNDANTYHFAAVSTSGEEREVIGCATFLFRLYDPLNMMGWALRGMAVSEACQGQGIGAKILEFAEQGLRSKGASDLLWCKARMSAVPFYQKCGWVITSDPFEIEGVGPHRKMIKQI